MKLVGLFALVFVLMAGVDPSGVNAMNKAELIDSIASESGLSKADSKRALEGFIDATTKALKKGDRVSLVGFGSFSVSKAVQNASPRGAANIPGERTVLFNGGDQPRPRPNEGITSDGELVQAIALELCLDEIPIEGAPDRARCEESLDIAQRFLDGLVPSIVLGLTLDGVVDLEGFGEFSVPGSQEAGESKARTGRNPQTGKEIKIAAKNVVKFKAGADLSKKVN